MTKKSAKNEIMRDAANRTHVYAKERQVYK